MHKNYYLFKAQVTWLKDKIQGYTILECFTYQKSELVLKISKNDEYFLRICVDPSKPYILLTPAFNIKDSKVDIFNDLIGQFISDFAIDNIDKMIFLNTDNFLLQSIFFGKTANIVLKDTPGNNIQQFKKGTIQIPDQPGNLLFSPVTLKTSQFFQAVQPNAENNVVKFIAKHIVGFNYTLARECCYRSQIDFDSNLSELDDIQFEILSNNIAVIGTELEDPIPTIYYQNEIPKHISIIKLKHLQSHLNAKTFNDINKAWDTFIWQKQKAQQFEKIHSQTISALKNRISYLQKTIKKIESFEKLEERKKISELKGNLLLTFKNEVPHGAKNIILKNIFSETAERVEIKLNPAKSVNENAQKYFEKFKDIDIQQTKLINRKSTLINELTSLNVINDKYSEVKQLKDIYKLKDLLIKKNILSSHSKNTPSQNITEHKFRKIVLDNKWNVYIGKNSENNDLLTFKFAHKHDWWFHAQGVPGSHTIIHLDNKNDFPPKEIIEQTASLAAFHSTDKHSKSVPVMYTQVRYVRRIKKAKPGTVSVLQHKTIFVEPKNL